MYKKILMMMAVAAMVFTIATPFVFSSTEVIQLNVLTPLVVSGNEVKPGRYDVEWDTANAELAFKREGVTYAKAKGKFVEVEQKYEYSSMDIDKDSAGRSVLRTLKFGGKKFRIVFE
jgi:hypothetical protein